MATITPAKIKERIKSAKKVAIFGHLHPDLDCFGAMFGAKYMCESLGVKCDIFSNFADDLFLLGIFPKSEIKTKFDKSKYDLILIVDCHTFERIDALYREDLAGKDILIIDHHKQIFDDKDIEFYIRSDKCSASIVIYDLLKMFKIKLMPEVATYIYAGIVGDTDRFLHNNTTPEVFDCASKLVKAGADVQKVYDVVYRSMTMSQIHLRNFLFENLTEFSEKVCYVVVSKADLAKLHATVEDLKMFVNDINLIKKYSAVVVAYEVEENNYKVSMRAKNNAEVLCVAVRHGGGGHKMAAGFSLVGNKRAVLSEIKKICKEF